MAVLEQSYAACRAVTERAGSSFSMGMRLFPKDRREAVLALYAFFRLTDDLVDGSESDETKRAALTGWREQVDKALGGGSIDPRGCLLAISDMARRHRIPAALFLECIDQCARDIGPVRMPDWESLLRYCDGVAGTVGEACLRILGYHEPAVLAVSHHNARAVQLTNILRDIDEDWRRDRIYLPQEVLSRHGVREEDFTRRHRPAALQAALREVGEQALRGYELADSLFFMLRPEHRPPIAAMTLRYRQILKQLRENDFAEVSGPPRAIASLSLLTAAQLARWMPTWRTS
ncbi:MAG: phytoene/squalene synthase family protein [Armatimonadetes bacterium]|nr:phytoene/squalene synthase family protein [Armatimonadota bacterium]